MLSIYLQILDSEGEKLLFEELYIKYRNLMYYIANSILDNPYDAEDVVHQSFLSIAKHIEKIETVDCPQTKSFVVIITKNKAIDLLRIHNHISAQEIKETDIVQSIQFPSDNSLVSAIEQLPDKTKSILLLYYDNGFSTREIAEMLKMNRGTVQKTLYRAKEKLRDILNNND